MISCVSGTYNRIKLLKRMVQSVRDSVGDLPYEIVIIDVGSTDGSREWLANQPDVVLLVQPEPLGSVVAFNEGFNKSKGDYVVVLNDDIAVAGDTIQRAYQYMEKHPEVGQVAFAHKYQNRNMDKKREVVQTAFGYVYGQCSMVRRWLGDEAGWWGDYFHYAGDNHLSARIWELGWKVVPLEGCSVIDWEHEDELRQKMSHAPRAEGGGVHPDTKMFGERWRGRLPKPRNWRPAPMNRVLWLAQRGQLRTLRFKGRMHRKVLRTALINAFREYGPAWQVDQQEAVNKHGSRLYQQWALEQIAAHRPDLVMLQAQRPGNILPETVREARARYPDMFIFNWDGDTHYPMLEFHYSIAKACHMQLVISPDLIPLYREHGVDHIGYWPIGVEEEFLQVQRGRDFNCDVVFLGTLYGEGKFPEATTRRRAVVALDHMKGITFQVHGGGWKRVLGRPVSTTLEQFTYNAKIYTKARMALSISQTADYWGYTSDRAYNIMATGCPILVQRFPGLEEHGMIDGKSCIAWSTIKEMLDKVRYYLNHNQEREAIGKAGKRLVEERHNWRSRLKGLFHMIGGMDDA